tara:strand:- start:709 stop:1530 length:822 start_codon:yes stop_codon:yes gene_type:complete
MIKYILINLLINIYNYNYYKLNINYKYINKYNINIIINLLNYINNKTNNNITEIIFQLLIYGKKYNLLSYGNKKIFFSFLNLPNIKNINFYDIKLSINSYYSISNYNDAKIITKHIYNIYNKKNIVITDATANIGGNTISFSLYNFKTINAVEYNAKTFRNLINNIKCYNLKNVKFFNNDYTLIYKKLKQDVVFLDPPWGGKNYKEKKNIDLYLSSINVVDIINYLYFNSNTTCIILKIPFNFNINYLKKYIKNFNIYRLLKYNIIIIKKQFI